MPPASFFNHTDIFSLIFREKGGVLKITKAVIFENYEERSICN